MMGALRGVDAKSAAWKPTPATHSIWELTLHLAYWIYAVRRIFDGTPKGSFPRAPSNFPAVPDDASEAAWKRDRTLLRDEYQRFLSVVRSLDDSLLDQRPAEKPTYRRIDLLFGIVQHNTHHTAQIQMLKRMQRSQRSQSS